MDDLLNELEPQGPAPEERERRRRLIAAVGIAGLSLLTVGTLSSGAFFSDTQTVPTGQIVTGSVVLANQTATAQQFAVTNMAPGDTKYGSVTVANGGSLQLRYAVTANTTAVPVTDPAIASLVAAAAAAGKTFTPSGFNLADQLQFTVCDKAFDASGNCAGGGTVLYGPNQPFATPAQTATPSNAATSVVLFGDPTDTNATAKATDRIVNPGVTGNTDTLYIKAYLDGPNTGNTWQATGTTISLVFNAFQTVNNP